MNVYQKFLKKAYKTHKIENFRELIYKSEEKYSKKEAFVLRDRNISYKEFKKDYQALGTSFLSLGLKGERIAVIGVNCYEWILSYLAASTVGVVVPIDNELGADDVVNFMDAAMCTAVVADPLTLDKISSNLPKSIKQYSTSAEGDHSIYRLIEHGKKSYSEGSRQIDTLPIDQNEMKVLIFTSGTTGSSKGVCLSHKNICTNIVSIAQMVKVSKKLRSLSILPLHHTYECTIGCILLLYGGGCISFCDGLSQISKNIQEYQPSVIIAVPRLLDLVLSRVEKSIRKELPSKYLKGNEDLVFSDLLRKLPLAVKYVLRKKVKASLGGKLEMLIVGAAAVKPEVVEAFCLLGIKTYQGYGLTECSPLLAGNNDFYLNSKSTGLPIHGVDLKIFEPNAEGIGEIIAKGDNIMLGYYEDPKATRAVLKDGYFHTGDYGRLDEDGFLYITGRKKNVIVTQSGKNIYPEELETRLDSEDVVAEVIVFGIADSRGNQKVKAKILPDLEAVHTFLQSKTPSKEDIQTVVQSAVDKINETLPSYKRIHVVEVLGNALERTTTQKIKRYGTNVFA